jgi:hypothetical protein
MRNCSSPAEYVTTDKFLNKPVLSQLTTLKLAKILQVLEKYISYFINLLILTFMSSAITYIASMLLYMNLIFSICTEELYPFNQVNVLNC